VPSDHAVPLGDASFDLGASLGVPAMTAHRCLFADGPIDGAGVLVAGGAGAVGRMAIELAFARPAPTVVATVSGPEKGELARAAGAHHVVSYRDDDAADQIRTALPSGVDRVVEVDLAHNLELDTAVIVNGAAVVTYADSGAEVSIPAVRALMTNNVVLRFVLLYFVPPAALAAAAEDVASAVRAGALTTLPLHRFTLDETAAAHDAVEAGTVGKVLIDVP
jgi:NADPH2:quinone reductase